MDVEAQALSQRVLDSDRQPLIPGAQPASADGLETPTPRAAARRWRLAALSGVAGALVGCLGLAGVASRNSAAASLLMSRSSNPFEAALLGAYADEAATLGAKMQVNKTIAKALAVLAKVSYCDNKPGVPASAAYSCGVTGLPGNSSRTRCEDAGFVVQPGFVRTVQVPGGFAIVSKVRLLDPMLATVEAYIVAFRGTFDTEEELKRDAKVTLVPLVEPAAGTCKEGRVHQGLYETWQLLKPGVVREIVGGSPAVVVTGHGTGAVLAAYAMYDLKAAGIQVLSSYVFSLPPPGDAKFADCFNKAFAGLTPLFRVTEDKDLACAPIGKAAGYVNVGAEVHFDGKSDRPEVCDDRDAKCGCRSYGKAPLLASETCSSSLAPEDNFCKFGSYQATCFLGTGFHWSAFGPSLGKDYSPVAIGLWDSVKPLTAATTTALKVAAVTVPTPTTPPTVPATTPSTAPATTPSTAPPTTVPTTVPPTVPPPTTASTTTPPAPTTAATTTKAATTSSTKKGKGSKVIKQ